MLTILFLIDIIGFYSIQICIKLLNKYTNGGQHSSFRLVGIFVGIIRILIIKYVHYSYKY